MELALKREKTLEKLSAMDDDELLDIFDLLVRVAHYDPVKTPDAAAAILDSGVVLEDVRKIVVGRMAGVRRRGDGG